MLNSNKVFMYLVGVIFLIAGLGVALELLNIPFSSITVLLVGIFILCLYFKFNIKALKYISCFFVPAGLAYFIIAAFQLDGVVNFVTLYSSLVCSFLCVYLLSKKKLFIYVALVISMYVLHSITLSNKSMNEFIFGYDCLYVGLLLTVLFIFEHKSLRYTPILTACIAYLFGLLNFLSMFKIITPTMFKIFVSLMFLVVGGGIILYNYIKFSNDNKENRCE